MNENRALIHHKVEAWTVGKLRESLAELPDDLPVFVQISDEPWGTMSTAYVAIAAETDTGLISTGVRGERYVLACSRPSGAYLRPKHGELIVTHGELTSDRQKALFERLIESVREATSATGYKGECTFLRATPEATKWSWAPTAGQPVSAESVTEAARAAATALNPSAWQIESKIAPQILLSPPAFAVQEAGGDCSDGASRAAFSTWYTRNGRNNRVNWFEFILTNDNRLGNKNNANIQHYRNVSLGPDELLFEYISGDNVRPHQVVRIPAPSNLITPRGQAHTRFEFAFDNAGPDDHCHADTEDF